MENWKKIKGYDGYEVSDRQHVRNKQGVSPALYVDKDGRYYVALDKNGKINYRYVDELSQEAFASTEETEKPAEQSETSIAQVTTKKAAKKAKTR